jgi:LPXTG-motif cell wall-anchored protein
MRSSERSKGATGQAGVEYLLVLGLVALVAVAGLWLWKPALAVYLERLAGVLTQAR